jgi:hypothetical protein
MSQRRTVQSRCDPSQMWSRTKTYIFEYTNFMLPMTISLWSSGHSSWLQIQRSGFDSQRYQIFWEVVGLERGPLTLVSTTEELLDIKLEAPV